jgi:nucleoside-diphosphate-sugar epimerase
MGIYVVLGAGAIGRGTAREIAAAGHTVRIVSRSGRGGGIPGLAAVAADVTDRERLAQIADRAEAIVNVLNPSQYWKWDELWPPMAAAILGAAERSGAALVTVNNLYLYGRVHGPMPEDTPVSPHGHKGEIRAQMWHDAVTLHDQGRLRTTELRASDYVGAGMDTQSVLNSFVIKPAMRGRGGWLPMGDPDAPHTWTSGRDVARLAARLATEPADSTAWGRPWHVPSAPARSMAEVAADTAVLVGQPVRRPHRIPTPVVDAVGLVHPLLRELKETRHQFERPFVLDSALTERTFGITATPWEVTLKETVDYLSGTAA